MTVQMVRVGDILDNIEIGVDSGWPCPTDHSWFDHIRCSEESLFDTLSDKQNDDLGWIHKGLEEDGWTETVCIVVDNGRMVYGDGHHRLTLMTLIGEDTFVPVNFVEDEMSLLDEENGCGDIYMSTAHCSEYDLDMFASLEECVKGF